MDLVIKDRRRAGIDSSEAMILVVGDDSTCKSDFALNLAEARGTTENHLHVAGVKVFTNRGMAVVMETTPLRTVEGLSRVVTGRVWVSQNSLRQLSGLVVFVVCCIASTNPTDDISWLSVLASVFEKNTKEIMILVNSKDSTEKARQKLIKALKKNGFKWQENIIFVSAPETGGCLDPAIIKRVLQSGVDGPPMSPVLLPRGSWYDLDNPKCGPWDPEHVILFGRSGSGKSTLANMLTSGRVDGAASNFPIGSGVSGGTEKVNVGQGRGWRVVDTPALLLEKYDESKTTDRVRNLIKDYLNLVEGVYCHFIYVWKKDGGYEADMRLWQVFGELFSSKGIEYHMTIVVSGSDQKWVNENLHHLRSCFVGCDLFIAAEFPPTEHGSKNFEYHYQRLRLGGLKELEKCLANRYQLDLSCRLGMWLRGTLRSEIPHGVHKPLATWAYLRQYFMLPNSLWHEEVDTWTATTQYLHNMWNFTTFVLSGEALRFPLMAREQALRLRETPGFEPSREPNSEIIGNVENLETKPVMGSPLMPEEKLQKEGKVDKSMVLGGTSNLLSVFIGVIMEKRDDGYFVSSEWLLRLEENEREFLMSLLRGAGYSQACQTSTVTLFIRLKNNVQHGMGSTEASRTFSSTEKMVDDGAGIARQGLRKLTLQEKGKIANASSSDDIGESSDNWRQVATWESFQAALKSTSHQSFCASTQWLAGLKEAEQEALIDTLTEARYVKTSETNNVTWFGRMQGQVRNITGSACDNDSSSSSNKNDVASDKVKTGMSKLSGLQKNMRDDDTASDSSDVTNRVETSQMQDNRSPCHPQSLSVKCSSLSRSPQVPLSPNGHFRRQQLGDVIVTMPGSEQYLNIPTAMEKRFSIMGFTIVDGRGEEIPMGFKAIAETSLSCCLKNDGHDSKVRIKISKISGKAEKDHESVEGSCNVMVVSLVCTNLNSCVRSGDSAHIEDIVLDLEDEYHHNPRRRVLLDGQVVEGGMTQTIDHVWMQLTGNDPPNSVPGSISLALQGTTTRILIDGTSLPTNKPASLIFKQPRPVIVEGSASMTSPRSFLEVDVRYQLEVSYYKPASNPISEGGVVWATYPISKVIHFDCCVNLSTESEFTNW
ncbi:unnamed protein product [Calypogeia fissa]